MRLPIVEIDFKTVCKNLTIKYQPMGAEVALELKAYRIEGGDIILPRQYGISLCAREGIEYEDQTSLGYEMSFPRMPEPRDYQVDALDQIVECTESYYDFMFRARTGWGKTIGSLIVAGRIGVTTLIVVDQENLKDQWIESLTKHFGFKLEDIGIIQGKKCIYEGKAVTIAMVQTLTQKRLPEEVYSYFGLIIVDEVHIIGAPTFNFILLEFSAAFRFGVSATPKRKDGLQKLLDWHLGRVRIWIEDEHDESAVYVMQHDTVYSEYANRAPKIGRFINEVTEDSARNLMLAEAAAYLYDTGRDCLALSDRIEHLHHFTSLLYYMGIPEEEMGVYAGYNLVYRYEKDPKPLRRPVGYERGTEYTPVRLSLISKKAKKAALETTKTEARIIAATYGKFSKGVDEPRLSGGIDLSPRSTSEQVQGRILRKKDGKLKPIWVTTYDINSYRSVFALAARLVDYEKNNSVVSQWSPEGGKVPCNVTDLRADLFERVKELKFLQIVPSSDGLNTLVTRREQSRQGLQRARTIVAERRRGHPVSPTASMPRVKRAR